MAKTIHLNDFKGGYATDIDYENIPNDTLANAQNIYWQNGLQKRDGYSDNGETKPWNPILLDSEEDKSYTLTLPDVGIIDMKWLPNFAYTTTTEHHFSSWQEDADSFFNVRWNTFRKCFVLEWQDNGTVTYVGPEVYFDDGTDYNDIAQDLRFIVSWDFPNSLLSLTIILADGTEYNATDDSFTGSFLYGDIDGDFLYGDVAGDFLLGDV